MAGDNDPAVIVRRRYIYEKFAHHILSHATVAPRSSRTFADDSHILQKPKYVAAMIDQAFARLVKYLDCG